MTTLFISFDHHVWLTQAHSDLKTRMVTVPMDGLTCDQATFWRIHRLLP